MTLTHRLMLACIPLAALAACGGGDTADRLDIADPAVRFVDVAPTAAPVTLYRSGVSQADATNAGFGFASNYFDVDTGTADWTVQGTAGGTPLGTVSINPERGTKYTIVAFASSATTNGTYLITDPYNKPLTSDSTHLRLFNGAYTIGSVDVYMTGLGVDISAAGVNPVIAGTAASSSGPAPGQDSIDIPGGTYQVTLAQAGTKTIVFRGQVSFVANQDLLLLALPATSPTGAVRLLLKTEGSLGTTEIPAS